MHGRRKVVLDRSLERVPIERAVVVVVLPLPPSGILSGGLLAHRPIGDGKS